MHEWGITQELIEEIKRQAHLNSVKTVTQVEISLGKDFNLTEQDLKMCFEALIKDDGALKDCKLRIMKTSDSGVIINRIEGESI